MRTATGSLLGLLVSIGTASAASPEHIGSWVLSCPSQTPDSEPCVLHLEKRFLDKGGITGDLEVQALGKTLVPVIALRGLPGEILLAASLAGKTDASMQFGDGPKEALTCNPSSTAYICSPKDDAANNLAAALPAARSVTVRVSVTMSGLKPLPVEEKSLPLSGTNEALARLRIVGPPQVLGPTTALASQSPAALMGMADKALKAAGYPNGVADLQALVAKYKSK
jgi:hypothetical protein